MAIKLLLKYLEFIAKEMFLLQKPITTIAMTLMLLQQLQHQKERKK